MIIFVGMMYLILLCGSILILSTFPISLYQKKYHKTVNSEKKATDYYSQLYDI